MSEVGKHVRTPETREKLRQARLGKPLSAETRAKISASHKGRIVSQETRNKLSRSQSGENNHRWKGGRVRAGDGYVGVKISEDHPFYERMGRSKDYVLEHRLVMAETIGRPLRDDETVHHLNGIRTDNRPENLELRMGRHGRGFTMDETTCPKCGHHFQPNL